MKKILGSWVVVFLFSICPAKAELKGIKVHVKFLKICVPATAKVPLYSTLDVTLQMIAIRAVNKQDKSKLVAIHNPGECANLKKTSPDFDFYVPVGDNPGALLLVNTEVPKSLNSKGPDTNTSSGGYIWIATQPGLETLGVTCGAPYPCLSTQEISKTSPTKTMLTPFADIVYQLTSNGKIDTYYFSEYDFNGHKNDK